jgi:RNA polymerase primary sigma factor
MRPYLHPPVADLAQQLTAGLLRLRKGYVDAAEDFLHIIRPELDYPYDLLVYRLTGYRPRGHNLQPLRGDSLRHDLQTLMLDLCDSFDLPADAYPEAAYDLPGLAAHLGVSTKTVQRWRGLGLVARVLVLEVGKKRIAFLERSVGAFIASHDQAVARSVRFSLLDEAERQEILRRARRLAQRTTCRLNRISRHLSLRVGRSAETIRYTIRNHDRQNPQAAIFPRHFGRMDDPARQELYRLYRGGASIGELMRQCGRTRGSIYRILNEMRALRLRQVEIDFMYNPEFELAAAGECQTPECNARPEGADGELLDAPTEHALFRRYNLLKFQADRLCKSLTPARARAAELDRIERLLGEAQGIKNRIVRANVRLVTSIAKRHARVGHDLPELVSDGNVVLMKAVEKFDYSRGNRFSTYASWAVMKSFARSSHVDYLLDRPSGDEETLSWLAQLPRRRTIHANAAGELRDSIQTVMARLDQRERAVIAGHFGLDESAAPMTLEAISRQMGLSKERVRQIERKAMEKLRTLLGPIQFELLGD